MMHVNKWLYSLAAIYLFALSGCDRFSLSNKIFDRKEITAQNRLFDILYDSVTNIKFINRVNENAIMNGYAYEYLYNGAGVSVGDLNNDGLPEVYFAANLIDNQLYLNNGNLRFTDITLISGAKGGYGFPQGTTMVDINCDGKLDIYICKSGVFSNPNNRRNELLINLGNNDKGIPIFSEQAKKFNLDLPHYSTQAAFFDYDKDGDLDMFLINHNTNPELIQGNMEQLRFETSDLTSDRLFRNDNEKFTDVSENAGLINNGIGFGLGVAIGDLNNDGWPDVIIAQDFTDKDRIYLNRQNGTFEEILNTSTGHISISSMGNDIADFNNDGWLDFMSLDMAAEDNYTMKASLRGMNNDQFSFLVNNGFHHQYMYNTLQLNNGCEAGSNRPMFSDIAEFAGMSGTDWSWGPLFFDMDNDGDKDLFVSNGIKRDFRNIDFILYKSKRLKAFHDQIENATNDIKKRSSGRDQHELIEQIKRELTGDFIVDLLSKMPDRKKDNYFFENKNDLEFEKKNGVWTSEKLTATNGAAFADLDNDGDLDIITNNMDERAFIYRNNSTQLGLGNYLKIHLIGQEKNPDGIGTRVIIKTRDGKQILEQYLTRGFQSSVDKIMHFGLGNQDSVNQLKVIWPDRRAQEISDIQANQTLTLNYKEATKYSSPSDEHKLFSDLTETVGLAHQHHENSFNDFVREKLLPYKMSQGGPALAIGDINNDNLDDFFTGGSKGQSGALFLQNNHGGFAYSNQTDLQKDASHEDVGACFFDADNDGDLDLYVVSGGNENVKGHEYYADRLYENRKGRFIKVNQPFSPGLAFSGSIVRFSDYDHDGDMDLFIGGRQIPGEYPFPGTSLLLRNDTKDGTIKFTRDKTNFIDKLGMVTDALWVDIDGDAFEDLIVVGEWMPVKVFKNQHGNLVDFTYESGLTEETGWWFSINAADFDHDGDMDLVVGNLGLNAKYKGSKSKPFEIYCKDFDNSGTLDIVLGYYQEDILWPLRGRNYSTAQMPFILNKFSTYHSFASARMEEVYGKDNLNSALHYTSKNFATCYFENNGSGSFKVKRLPNKAQLTTVRDIVIDDVNTDGNPDIILLGNMYGFEVETPRQDAGFGLYLQGDGKGNFTPLTPYKSGLYVKGNIANAGIIKITGNQKAILVAKNDDFMQLIKIK